MTQEIWTSQNGTTHPKDCSWPFIFELGVITSTDSVKSKKSGYPYSETDPAFELLEGAPRFKITKEMAKRITRMDRSKNWGFKEQADGTWKLSFEYKLDHHSNGMLVLFKVRIPEGGFRKDEDGRDVKCKMIEETFPVDGHFQTAKERSDTMDMTAIKREAEVIDDMAEREVERSADETDIDDPE